MTFPDAIRAAERFCAIIKDAEDLVIGADEDRIVRSAEIVLDDIKVTPTMAMATATVRGRQGGRYHLTIKFGEHRTYRCTCPDHQKRAGFSGPCKHILALANESRRMADGELQRISQTVLGF